MRKTIIFIMSILLSGFPAVSYGDDGVKAPQSATLQPPAISAQTAILIEADSGEILYEKDPDKKSYPASITKIMTALLAIESGALDRMVKISDSAAGVEGSSIYLEPGEKISLRDLVYGLMLRSGNDAATAIAEEVGGKKDSFAMLMNKKARELGAFDTHFANPSGLHDPNHYTTARDMACIAAAAMRNPEFKKIASSKSWVTDRGDGKYNYFYNKNKVVYQYSGGTGIKIGYTRAAGRTLVASSERNGMALICVVMNAPDWFQDTYKLMDYAYSQYETITILPAKQPIKAVRVWGGSRSFAMIGSEKELLCPVRKGSNDTVSIVYDLPQHQTAPIARWQDAGRLKIYINGEYLFSRPLQYLEDIE